MRVTRFAHAASLALLLHVGSVVASPLMDLRAEDLLPLAPQLRTSLALNANQQLLWQQSEARTVAARDQVELRDLDAAAETEAAASALEDAQLRGMWLTMNDALDDAQRRTVLRFLADQLERVRSGAPERGEGKAGRDGGHGGPGGGRGRPGGAGNGLGAGAGTGGGAIGF